MEQVMPIGSSNINSIGRLGATQLSGSNGANLGGLDGRRHAGARQRHLCGRRARRLLQKPPYHGVRWRPLLPTCV